MDPNVTAVIDKGMRLLRLIWTLMIGTLGVYLFICHQFGNEIRAKIDVPIDTMRLVLYLFAAVNVMIAYYTRKMLLSGKFTLIDQKAINSNLLGDKPLFLSKYATAMIVALALSESIAIFGLVLFLLGDTYKTLHIFISISAAAMVYFRPKQEEIVNLSIAMKAR